MKKLITENINLNGKIINVIKGYEEINYKLIVDNGKPYEETFNNKEELFLELNRLKDLNETEDVAYFDITILNEQGQDITKEIFKEIEMKGGLTE